MLDNDNGGLTMSFCPVTASLNAHLKAEDDYISWIESHEDGILEHYRDSEPEAPESIYNGVTDDDYPATYDKWLENLTIDDVPDDFISNMYDSSEGGYGDKEADAYDIWRDRQFDRELEEAHKNA